jgi:hypothetical protein
VTQYSPAARFEISSADSPFDHIKEYGGVPPEAVISIAPSFSWVQVTSVMDAEALGGSGSEISKEFVAVHPYKSVTVTT